MSDEDIDAMVEEAAGWSNVKIANQIRAKNPKWRADHAENMRKLHADPVFRAKNAAAMRKLAQDPGWRANHAEYLRNMHADPGYRAKHAEANRKRAQDPVWRANVAESNRKRSIPIVCIETGIVYEGGKWASEQTGIDQGNITQVCKGHKSTAGGFHWRYATPEEAATVKSKAKETK